jgi:hypothetical protein
MASNRALSNFTRFMQSRGIAPRDFGPGGAYDSMPRARDGDPDDKPAPSAIAGMLALKAKMSPDGFRALCDELCGGEGAEDKEFETPEDRLEAEAYPGGKRATDEPAPFKGRPRSGGAMDMAFDGPPRRKSRGEKSFAAMYGNAALSIKTNSDPYPIASRTRA